MPSTIHTKQGALPLPLFVPQLTLPLGERAVPYLHQLSYCVAIDPFTGGQLTPETLPALPRWVVPYQLQHVKWTPADGLSVRIEGQRLDREGLLKFQVGCADIGLTLGIPPGVEHPDIRLKRSCDNALWAVKQASGIPLLATLPFTTIEGTYHAVQKLWARGGFSGIALLLDDPLLSDLLPLVQQIRQRFDGTLHLCGLDEPTVWQPLFEAGVSSVSSSQWLDWAQQGRKFGVEGAIPSPSRDEKLHLALLNLSLATQLSLPLAMVANDFSTWLLRDEHFTSPTPIVQDNILTPEAP